MQTLDARLRTLNSTGVKTRPLYSRSSPLDSNCIKAHPLSVTDPPIELD